MAPVQRYAVTLPGAPGTHAPPRTVVVHLTPPLSPHDDPIYTDDSGRVRVRVGADGIAQLLDGPVTCHRGQCVHAVELP